MCSVIVLVPVAPPNRKRTYWTCSPAPPGFKRTAPISPVTKPLWNPTLSLSMNPSFLSSVCADARRAARVRAASGIRVMARIAPVYARHAFDSDTMAAHDGQASDRRHPREADAVSRASYREERGEDLFATRARSPTGERRALARAAAPGRAASRPADAPRAGRLR